MHLVQPVMNFGTHPIVVASTAVIVCGALLYKVSTAFSSGLKSLICKITPVSIKMYFERVHCNRCKIFHKVHRSWYLSDTGKKIKDEDYISEIKNHFSKKRSDEKISPKKIKEESKKMSADSKPKEDDGIVQDSSNDDASEDHLLTMSELETYDKALNNPTQDWKRPT